MRRLFGWLAGLAGVAALARVLARRSAARTSEAPVPTGDDPAEELREKLSRARARPEPAEPAPPAVEHAAPAAEDPGETLDLRRARVHAKAQDAIDAMQEPERPA